MLQLMFRYQCLIQSRATVPGPYARSLPSFSRGRNDGAQADKFQTTSEVRELLPRRGLLLAVGGKSAVTAQQK